MAIKVIGFGSNWPHAVDGRRAGFYPEVMTAGLETREEPRPLDFFISYSPADERWATWMAWTLEDAGYRTVLQAWDFVPGTNFMDFMDRGVTESAAVIAVLSDNYLRSQYGRLEWQSAMRLNPTDGPYGRLLTVRIEEVAVEGLLANITWLDLVGVADSEAARALLLNRVAQAVDGRARPKSAPGFPGSAAVAGPGSPVLLSAADPAARRPLAPGVWPGRRRPAAPPVFPWDDAEGRDAVTVLHLAGPAFGHGSDPERLQSEIGGDLLQLADAGAPRPDLLVVTGDLTAGGRPQECEQALSFLTGLRSALSLEAHRVAVVPGGGDVNIAACLAYFNNCAADEVVPRPPYWPKWRHYARLLAEFYQGLDVVFDADQPWSLFPVPELRTVIAGFNSSMAWSHQPEHRHGRVGDQQALWFSQALRQFEQEGWLRIGAVRHPVHEYGGGTAADALRDAKVFTRLGAPRLNVLLHGPLGFRESGRVGGYSGALRLEGGELPLFGLPGPGRHQLLLLTRDGVTRWQPHADGAPETRRTVWRSAESAFAVRRSPDGEGEGVDAVAGTVGGEPPEARAMDAPWAGLLARVSDVCRARHQDVALRTVLEPLPHLVATWTESGFVRQQRVAVRVGTPSQEDVEQFVAHLHASGGDPDAELVHDGPAPDKELRERARRRGVLVRSFTAFQGLLDLREYVEAQSDRLRTDQRYPPELYLDQGYREAERPDGDEHDDLVGDLLRMLDADHGRFVLLLGDFGHGKSFALRETARRLPQELPHLIPLLIDLSELDRAHRLDGLVAAHLAGHGVDSIDLRAIRYMLAQGRIVLLFDGFDELVSQVSYERAADHLQVLLESAVDNAKIVVSSRTQHFRSQAQVLTALGEQVGLLPQRRVLAIDSFTPDQIRRYLVNRSGDERAADHRIGLLEGIPGLLALCRNPRLLGFVAEIESETLRAVAGAGRALSAAGLYQQVLRSWLEFEEARGQGGPGAHPGLTLEQLWQAATELALRVWESGRQALHLDELTSVAETMIRLADTGLGVGPMAHAVGSGTLLVRDEEGTFRFIHGSVAEFLVAREMAARLGDGAAALLGRRRLEQLAVEFLCDLADHERLREWADGVLEGPAGGVAEGRAKDIAQANALKVLERLRVPTRTDLRGAALAGQDLSYRDFSGVDLSRADLTGARLIRANFSGAVLRGARLVGARLDDADLTGADLTGADLRRARLTRTDLRGARLEGSRWRRAALIRAVTDAPPQDVAELRLAAVAPGMPVELDVRPPTVGVPYGYGTSSGRLPEPVAFSPDGELLAVGGEDGSVLVCDGVTGTALRTLRGHGGRAYAVKFRAGVLATGAADGTVRLWDPVSGRCLRRIEVHRSGVWPVALNAEGSVLATGDADGVVTLWKVATGEEMHRLPGHRGPVYSVHFSPDGSMLATGDAAARVRLWSATSGCFLGEFAGHRSTAVYRVRFSPDGSLLATGDGGEGVRGSGRQAFAHGRVRVWDVARQRLLHEFTGHAGKVYTLDFHDGGRLLASADTKGEVRLWDAVAGVALGRAYGCTGAVYQVAFHEDAGLLAAGDSDGHVRVWQVPPGAADGCPEGSAGGELALLAEQPPDHHGSVWACLFRPRGPGDDPRSGPFLLSASAGGEVQLWDTATRRARRVADGHGRKVTSLSWSADGALLASSGNGGTVRIWEGATGRRVRELTGRADQLVSAVFGPRESLLATASNDGDVHLWNGASGEARRTIDAETDHVWAEAFSTDGMLLATANDDDTVSLWHRDTGALKHVLSGHRGRVRSIRFAPDDETVVTGCDDQRVRIWDVDSGRLTAELSGHRDRVYAVVFTADGTLATASWDGEVMVWRGEGSALRLRDDTGKLWAAAAHPLSPVLVASGDDGVVRLWDTRDGRLLHRLTGHAGRVLAVALSPDGGRLASGGEDGTIRLWALPAEPADAPVLVGTLIGAAQGWAALTPSGGYKAEGDMAGEFWHVVGVCRFEPGELDGDLPGPVRLALDTPL